VRLVSRQGKTTANARKGRGHSTTSQGRGQGRQGPMQNKLGTKTIQGKGQSKVWNKTRQGPGKCNARQGMG
jgi:hypothetical protein